MDHNSPVDNRTGALPWKSCRAPNYLFSMARKKIQPRNLLTLVPVRIAAWTTTETGLVVVQVPRFGPGRLGRWFSRTFKLEDLQVNLDELGSPVWKACDGRSTVEEIGEKLRAEFGERIEPLHDRLALFFKQLERSEFIRLADEAPEVPGTRETPS